MSSNERAWPRVISPDLQVTTLDERFKEKMLGLAGRFKRLDEEQAMMAEVRPAPITP
jgi:hypothetical protein